jgi:pyruvate/2-oxoglutarate dehydrogenase complex dihydrolipoamide acyltransferase (E2) component
METFDPYRAVTTKSINKTLQDVQEMNFDIFAEIDMANAYYKDYIKVGGAI